MKPPLDDTHDPSRISRILTGNGHPEVPIQNLPRRVSSAAAEEPRGRVAIGDRILDLSAAAGPGLPDEAQVAEDTMAFMPQSRWAIRPTRSATSSPLMQLDHEDGRDGFARAPAPGGRA